jgi:RNase H-like domain found in reverse transcriptase
LHTDASDYGIGGYLFQLVNGNEHPIAFVSKSLSLSQIRWAVIQKEASAIFYVCMHLKSLLQDRKFTLRTDHRNLLYITENSYPMIVWRYMALSEYSFNLEFISGEASQVADLMSRLCRNNMTDSPREYSDNEILSANIIEKQCKSSQDAVLNTFEKIKEMNKLYNLENAEKIKESNKQYKLENAEIISEKNKLFREENAESINKVCVCNCGSNYTHHHESRHKRTKNIKNS